MSRHGPWTEGGEMTDESAKDCGIQRGGGRGVEWGEEGGVRRWIEGARKKERQGWKRRDQ